jgi:hypothetical protein
VVAVALVVLAVVAGGFVLLRGPHDRASRGREQTPKASGAKVDGTFRKSPTTVAATARAGSVASLALELQPDGLHIGGSLVTGDNMLPAVAKLLGAPTRTNHVAQTGTVIYAYDQHGLLLYSQKAGGTNSILLDCEATGDANGTTAPFAGTLRVEDQVIDRDTDSQTLTAMKQLGLGKPTVDGSIWSGHYNTLALAFAYQESLRRLSTIVIDLK